MDGWKSAQKYDWSVFQTEEYKKLKFDLKIMNFKENRYKYFQDYQSLRAKWESKKFFWVTRMQLMKRIHNTR